MCRCGEINQSSTACHCPPDGAVPTYIPDRILNCPAGGLDRDPINILRFFFFFFFLVQTAPTLSCSCDFTKQSIGHSTESRTIDQETRQIKSNTLHKECFHCVTTRKALVVVVPVKDICRQYTHDARTPQASDFPIPPTQRNSSSSRASPLQGCRHLQVQRIPHISDERFSAKPTFRSYRFTFVIYH